MTRISYYIQDTESTRHAKKQSSSLARSFGLVEGEEPACVGPDLLVHDGVVRDVLAGEVHGYDAQPVVDAVHELLLAAGHPAEPEPVVGVLDVLRHRPRADLLDLSVVDVGDGSPPPGGRRDEGAGGGNGNGDEEEAAGPHDFVRFEAGLDRVGLGLRFETVVCGLLL